MESLNKNQFAITLTAVVFGILGFLLGRQGKQQHMMFMKGGPDKMLGGKNMIMIKKEDGKEIESAKTSIFEFKSIIDNIDSS